MKLKVTGERVAIKPDELPEMNSEGTLYTPWTRKRSTMQGTVVALGDGPYFKGGFLPHTVAVGDKVIFSPESGEEVICERSLYVFMKETDILAVIG